MSQPLPSVKSSVDKNRILIGEQFSLKLEARFTAADPISFFDIDSIDHFEILQRQKIDTQDNRTEIILTQSLLMTSFDSGHWAIPALKIESVKTLLTDSIPMDVAFSSPFDPSKPYHDIKDVIDVERTKKKEIPWWWYAAGGLGLLLLILLIYFLTRKKKKPTPAIEIDAYQEAKKQLSQLAKENLNSKQFFTRLVDIFRWYLQRRLQLVSFEKTTPDVVDQLQTINLPQASFTRTAQVLRLSDFVKFARFEPADQDRKDSFNIISATIDEIEKMHQQPKPQ